MPEVDPRDDTIARWVVLHYRYDPERHERRNVIIAVYNNEAEFTEAITAYGRQIRRETAQGTRDTNERVHGETWGPGYHAEQVRRRILSAAISRGVDPRQLRNRGVLPSNTALLGLGLAGTLSSVTHDDAPAPPAA